MIPILLGGAALWGMSNLSNAERHIKNANEINAQAAFIANAANHKVRNAHSHMTNILSSLGALKMDIMSDNIDDVVDTMSGIYKNFKLNRDTRGLRELEDNGFSHQVLDEMHTLSNKAIELAHTEIITSPDSGVFCAIGMFGSTVLGLSAIAAPAMLLYSFMQSDEAEAALYEAKTKLDEARYYEARSENICALFHAISKRGQQIQDLLNSLNNYLTPAVMNMNSIKDIYGYDYRQYSEDAKANVFYMWQIAQTVKSIIDTSIIQEDWSINPDLEEPIEIGQQTIALLNDQ